MIYGGMKSESQKQYQQQQRQRRGKRIKKNKTEHKRLSIPLRARKHALYININI